MISRFLVGDLSPARCRFTSSRNQSRGRTKWYPGMTLGASPGLQKCPHKSPTVCKCLVVLGCSDTPSQPWLLTQFANTCRLLNIQNTYYPFKEKSGVIWNAFKEIGLRFRHFSFTAEFTISSLTMLEATDFIQIHFLGKLSRSSLPENTNYAIKNILHAQNP